MLPFLRDHTEIPTALVTADPGGRRPGSRGGTCCPAVDSHHSVTGSGASDWLAR